MEEKKAALALVPPQQTANLGVSGGLAINGFAEMEKAAKLLSQANGIVPRAYQGNPAAVAAIIMTGFELGIAPMTAMRELHLIEGKVSLSATLMLTLARRAGIRTRWLVTDATKATIGVIVPGQAEQTMTFSKEDAIAAGLWGKGNWSKHPAAMLRARATSGAIRAFCPEAIGGSVYESDSGEVTDGVPAGDIIDATAVRTVAPVVDSGPPIPRAVKDVADAAMLKRYCEKHGEAILKAKKAEACVARGEALNVPPAEVRAWLGIPEVMPDSYDPSEQDAPPPDDSVAS
jgi:hypothetical protein